MSEVWECRICHVQGDHKHFLCKCRVRIDGEMPIPDVEKLPKLTPAHEPTLARLAAIKCGHGDFGKDLLNCKACGEIYTLKAELQAARKVVEAARRAVESDALERKVAAEYWGDGSIGPAAAEIATIAAALAKYDALKGKEGSE